MCGLIGAFRAKNSMFPVAVKNYIAQGLYVSALRGMGGTGVGLVDKDWDVDLVKSHVDAGNFIFTDKYDWVEKNAADSRAIIGHTRAPTGTAAVTSKNAHPFWFGEPKTHKTILGTHNGHISNYTTLTPHTWNHPVDSAHAFYSIYLNGAKETLEKIDGYYVLIWYDENKKTMNMARNSHRELYLAWNKARTQAFYASEEIILQFALDRAGIEWDKEYGFRELTPFNIYSWDLNEPTVEVATITEYKEKKWTDHYSHAGTQHGETRRTGTDGSKFGEHWIKRKDGTESPLMPVHSKFYCRVTIKDDDPLKPFFPYKAKAGNQIGKDLPYGELFGTRVMDEGLVKITGVKKQDWLDKWQYLKDAVPCICTLARIETHGEGSAKQTFASYEARLDEETATREYETIKRNLETKKNLEKKEGSQNVNGAPYGSSDNNIRNNGETFAGVYVEGPDKKMISQISWLKMAKEGCIICHGTITLSDIGKVLFYPWSVCPEDDPKDVEHSMVCPVCAQNPQDVQKALGYIPL